MCSPRVSSLWMNNRRLSVTQKWGVCSRHLLKTQSRPSSWGKQLSVFLPVLISLQLKTLRHTRNYHCPLDSFTILTSFAGEMSWFDDDFKKLSNTWDQQLKDLCNVNTNTFCSHSAWHIVHSKCKADWWTWMLQVALIFINRTPYGNQPSEDFFCLVLVYYKEGKLIKYFFF